jgi:hypothetical protein
MCRADDRRGLGTSEGIALVAARQVYLHIGAPKTGTTYLQRVLHNNRDALAACGVLYATGSTSRDPVWAAEVLRGLDLSRHWRSEATGAWDRIVDQVRGWDGTVVISHEFFGACTAPQAQRALNDLAPSEVHLVFTARDYVSAAGAVWQERIKYGHATRFSDFRLDDIGKAPMWSWRTQDVLAILTRWQHDLAPSRVHVVTVPRGGRTELLWERFASAIGVDPAVASVDIPSANTSLGLAQAELLRRVDERIGTVLWKRRHYARWTRDLLANTVLSRGSRERFSVSGPYAAELQARAREAVSGISEAGWDVVGSLDDLLPPEPLPVTRSPDDASSEELLDTAIDAIVGLIAEAVRADAQHQEQLERLRGRRRDGPRYRKRAARLRGGVERLSASWRGRGRAGGSSPGRR